MCITPVQFLQFLNMLILMVSSSLSSSLLVGKIMATVTTHRTVTVLRLGREISMGIT